MYSRDICSGAHRRGGTDGERFRGIIDAIEGSLDAIEGSMGAKAVGYQTKEGNAGWHDHTAGDF